MSIDDFIADMLQQAADQFPECGFLLYVVNDEKEGELTVLTNMDPEEVEDVHGTATYDAEQFIPVVRRKH